MGAPAIIYFLSSPLSYHDLITWQRFGAGLKVNILYVPFHYQAGQVQLFPPMEIILIPVPGS